MKPLVPIKRLATITLGKMVQPEPKVATDISAPYLRAAHVQPQGRIIDLPDQQMWFKKSELRDLTLWRGDVVVIEGGAAGRSAVIRDNMPGWGFQNSIIRLRPVAGAAEGRYLDYALQDALNDGRIGLATNTATLAHLTAEKLSKFEVPSPSCDEQRAIADYLDQETAQIDALVAKQEEFIGLLRERRDSVVRVEIAQQEAAHPVDKLGRSAKIGNGSTPRRDMDEYWRDGDVPWLTSAAVNLPEVVIADQFVTEVAVRECHLPRVEPGDLLIGLIGQGPTRGRATISRVGATLSQNLAYIAPDRAKWVSEYLLWTLQASYGEIRQKGAESGAAQGMLNTDDIRRVRVAMPPISEQRQIADRLNEQTGQIDALIAKAEEHIVLAKERRAALITAAVTGQIDVRTAAQKVS